MTTCCVSPDGRWVAFQEEHTRIHVFDAATGKRVWQSPAVDHAVNCCFTPDSQRLDTNIDGGRVYAVGSWEPGLALGPGVLADMTSEVAVLKLTNGIYRLVELATGRELARLEDPESSFGMVTLTPDGTKLLVCSGDQAGSQGFVHEWDLRRIRAELAQLGLDWQAAPYRPAPKPAPLGPLEVQVDLGEVVDYEKYTLILTYFPFHAEAYYRRGLAHLRGRQWREAFADFDMAATLQPDHAEAFYQRGAIHALQGRFQKARADLTQAIALKRDHAAAHGERGHAHLGLGQWAEAIADYTWVLERTPDDPGFWFGRGKAHARLYEWQLAVADYSRCLALFPDPDGGVLTERARAYSRLGQWHEAAADYTKALEQGPLLTFLTQSLALALKPDHERQELATVAETGWFENAVADPSTILTERGNAHFRLGHWDKAVADFSKTLELLPRACPLEVYIRQSRAEANAHLGAWGQVKADCEAIVALRPEEPADQRALVWFLTTCREVKYRDPDRAVRLAKQAVERGPQDGFYWQALGVAQYRAGDYKAAREALKEGARLRMGSNGFNYFLEAMICHRLGQRDDALRCFNEGLAWMEKRDLTLLGLEVEVLSRFRAEAEELLGITRKKP
jgi:tetratricopeptide (TPR) repeat protein